jgi:hypothetical protein
MRRTGASAPARRDRPVRPTSCTVRRAVRRGHLLRTPSDGAVQEGYVVLVYDFRPASERGRPGGEVRRAGDSVLLLGARDERTCRTPAAPPLRLSKFHAPEIVFGPDSVQEAAHAAALADRSS